MSVSSLTFSYFEDTSWYQTDHKKSEFLGFGKFEGCLFLSQRCEVDWPANRGYFCRQATQGCSADRLGKGNCNVFNFGSSLPVEKQRFTTTTQGGKIINKKKNFFWGEIKFFGENSIFLKNELFFFFWRKEKFFI
jgi:hypothetical protein